MPAPQRLFVAVEVGTTGARAVAVDLCGRVVAEDRRAYITRQPHPGWAEQDPDDWAENSVVALAGLLTRLGPRRSAVAALGLTGQCPTVAPFGADLRPVGPGMMYRDNRAAAEAVELRERIGVDRMHERTGHTAEAFHIGPKILWLRRHRPDVFGRTRLFLQPRDVVLLRLTGRVATDESHADATLFYDLVQRRWAVDLLAAVDLDPALFPEALPPWAVAGTLLPDVADELGLDASLPVVIGAGDSQCVAFGSGVVEPGPVSEMAGASSCLNTSVRRPRRDRRITHYSHVVPDRFTTELGLNTTGAALAWAVSRLGYDDYDRFAADADIGRKQVTASVARDVAAAAPYFLPYLGDGERDDPTAHSALMRLSDRHDRPAIAFAVVEGVALAVSRLVAILRRSGCPVEELRVSGGGARLDVVGRVKADVLGVPVRHLDVDASAVGAAMLAATATGHAAEAAAALAQVLERGRVFAPDDDARGAEAVRAAVFARLRRKDIG